MMAAVRNSNYLKKRKREIRLVTTFFCFVFLFKRARVAISGGPQRPPKKLQQFLSCPRKVNIAARKKQNKNGEGLERKSIP